MTFLGILERHQFQVKSAGATFVQLLEEFCYFLCQHLLTLLEETFPRIGRKIKLKVNITFERCQNYIFLTLSIQGTGNTCENHF